MLGAALLLTPWATSAGLTTTPTDALFVAMSAATVTGLSPVDTGPHWEPFGEAVILALIQLSGLGFSVGASLVLLLIRRQGSLRGALIMRDGSPALTLREALELSGRIVRFVFVVEGAGAVLFTIHFWRIEGMPFWTAVWFGVFHSVSAFCNAGFDLGSNFSSFIPYRDDILVNVTTIALIQLGALSYIVYQDLWTQRRWRLLHLDTKLILILNGVALVAGAVIFLLAEWNASLSDTPTWARPMSAVFQSVSSRTAGYATVNFADVTAGTFFVFIGLMAIGGAPGSTAGGVKLSTVGVIAVAVLSAVRGYNETQVFGRRLAAAMVVRALAIVTVFAMMYFIVVVALSITEADLLKEQFSTAELMFEAMSALATVGLSTGLTAEVSEPGRIVLIIAMFAGRLGPLTVAYALQGRHRPPRYRYPEEPVRMG